MSFKAKGKALFIYKYHKDESAEAAERILLKDAENIITDMEEKLAVG